MDNSCCQLQLNPDITGIGVRVALYVQILLGWVTSLYWPDTFAKNSRTAYMTALALLIASFIELTTQTLSLLDGIVVSYITTMMIAFAIASYAIIPEPPKPEMVNGDPKPRSVDDQNSFSRRMMQVCFAVFWAAWCFNMWRDPATFGLKDEAAGCDTNYNVTMQLFTTVHATDPNVRSAAITLVSFGFAIAVFSLFIKMETFVAPILWALKKLQGQEQQQTERGGQPKFIKYEDHTLQGIHLIFQAITVGTFIFLIYATEQTIRQNDVDRETQDWTYGQTIALILLLQQIMDLFSTYIEQQEKKEEERERQERDAAARGDTAFEMYTPTKQMPDPIANDANAAAPTLPSNAPPASAPAASAPAASAPTTTAPTQA